MRIFLIARICPLAALAWAFAAPAITVDGAADGTLSALAGNGTCELREALAAANDDRVVDACEAGAGADTIDFAPGIGLIQLTAGQLEVSSSLTIAGPGSDALVIDQLATNSRVVEVDDEDSTALSLITFTGLELTGGSVIALVGASGSGGAILNREDLTLDDVTLRSNEAQDGAAIFSTGALLIRGSRLLDHTAGTGSGVLACEQDSSCALEDTVVRGAESASGPAFGRMRQSTDVELIRSELSDFSGPLGGYALVVDNVNLKFENSTYSDVDVRFLSVQAGSVANIEFSTVAGAQADLFVSETSTLNIRASIIEGSLSKAEMPPLLVPVLVASLSVFADPNLDGSFFFSQTANRFRTDPRLEPLRANGGPTRSHDLEPNSPARDIIAVGVGPCGTIVVDQRGLARPDRDFCDAGAVESGSGLIFEDGFER